MILPNKNTKKILICFLSLACLFLVIGTIFIYIYYANSKAKYITITENSRLDYQVCLKQNEFYEASCVSKGDKYISSLIDYIKTSFNYTLSLSKKIDYSYYYTIDATFNVLDKNDQKTLFTKTENLYKSEKKLTSNSTYINYELDIDYNKYNDLLSSFINIYDLEDTNNNLEVNMNIYTISDSGVVSKFNNNSFMKLTIPLTKKTVNIDIKDSIMNNGNKKIKIIDNKNYMSFLIISIASYIGFLTFISCFIYYYKNTRTIKEIYDNRIKKILSNYDSYIQRINGHYPIGASEICKVSTFRDMLEIKDSTDKPLLMLENEEKTGVFFLIPVGEGVIYTYALRIEDILAEKNGTAAPDYDVYDIYNKDDRKVVYTKEKIQEDIEKTTSLKIIDSKNSIKGTKDDSEDLYDQLEKTMSFKIIKEENKKKNTRKTRKQKVSTK